MASFHHDGIFSANDKSKSYLSAPPFALRQETTGAKDLGVEVPGGADLPFDGTMKSVKENWERWPKKDMDISRSGFGF
ncbi:MAG: hypothetical protein ACJAQT_001455 [Akkermansiaceae bacterium]|jgi:hypothetical protein